MIRCEPRQLLAYSHVITRQDKYERERLIHLYVTMKKVSFIHNVTEIVMNTQYIYSQYWAIERGETPRVCGPDGSYEPSTKEELTFIASLFLSLSLWYPTSSDEIWLLTQRVFSGDDDKIHYSCETIKESIMIVFGRLSGSITREPIINDVGLKHTLFHSLLMWFSGYRFVSFIPSRYIRLAIVILVHDLEHMTLGASCYLHRENDIRIMCQIMVNYFSTLFEQTYSDRPEDQKYKILKQIGTFHYIDADDIDIDTTPLILKQTDTYKSLDQDAFECIGILSHRANQGTVVYRALNDDARYTIKRYSLRRPGEEAISVTRLCVYIQEVSIINILREYDAWIGVYHAMGYDSRYRYGHIYMSPYGLSLIDFMSQNAQYLTSTALESIFYDMAMCVSICDRHDIVHNDIKPENFIVEDCRIKLVDFGIARCHFSYHAHHDDTVQTLDYRAPELILGDTMHDSSIDVWALACTAYEVLTGHILFHSHRKDHPASSNSILTLNERNIRIRIIMSRLNVDYYEEAPSVYLGECPLWDKCVRMMIPVEAPLHGKYPPIEWSTMNEKMETLIKECLNLTPSMRPSATEITDRLVRGKSLF